MNGVILFADDEIYSESSTFEKSLFKSMCNKNKHPIVGVTNLDLAEKALRSLSAVKAFILDYIFKEDSGSDELPSRDRRAIDLLTDPKLSIFTLIYIYSQTDIEGTQEGERLKRIYKDRIRFRTKSSDIDKADKETEIILEEIDNWEKEHENFLVFFRWNQSINQAVQRIFSELVDADKNWISELYKTSKKDGAEPSVEVINLFQNILSENIIQDDELRGKIREYAEKGEGMSSVEHYAKLIRILYYGITKSTDPIMTGDIFVLPKDKFGIIITPECDIRHIITEPTARRFELLVFAKDDFQKSKLEPKFELKAKPLIEKAKELAIEIHKKHCPKLSETFNNQVKAEKKKGLIEAFTQTYPRFHLLPCFEFTQNDYSGIAIIDFRIGLDLILASDLIPDKRIGKLNTPYIQELRQRYLSYKGRIGVPAFSNELKKWLLEKG